MTRWAWLAGAVGLVLTGAAPGQVEAANDNTPAWLRYTRPPTFTPVTDEIRVPLRDGITMRCTLTRPGQDGVVADGRYPAIVSNFFAYRVLQQTAMVAEADMFASHGYVVLMCSPRSSGGTPGKWQPFAMQERHDLYDLIEWAGTQSWSTGKVGVTGASYGGISTYNAAASGRRT